MGKSGRKLKSHSRGIPSCTPASTGAPKNTGTQRSWRWYTTYMQMNCTVFDAVFWCWVSRTNPNFHQNYYNVLVDHTKNDINKKQKYTYVKTERHKWRKWVKDIRKSRCHQTFFFLSRFLSTFCMWADVTSEFPQCGIIKVYRILS